MVRNGLMQALLAASPMRRKNFAALEIGRSIVKQDGTWWIILTAADTKEKRADERPIEDYIGKESTNTCKPTGRFLAAGKTPLTRSGWQRLGKPCRKPTLGR